MKVNSIDKEVKAMSNEELVDLCLHWKERGSDSYWIAHNEIDSRRKSK